MSTSFCGLLNISRPGCHLHVMEKPGTVNPQEIGTQRLLLESFHHHHLSADSPFVFSSPGAHGKHEKCFMERLGLEFNADIPVAGTGTGVCSSCSEYSGGFSTGPCLSALSWPAAECFSKDFAPEFTHLSFPWFVILFTSRV